MNNKKEQRQKRIRLFAGILLVVGALGAFVAYRVVNSRRQMQAELFTSGDIVTAFTGDLSAAATASGTVRAPRAAQLALMQPGTVAELYVDLGQTVQTGDLLLKLDTAELERARASAQQTLLIQENNLAQLLAPASAADIASADVSVTSAQAALDDLLAGPTENEIASAEADVRAANADVAAASARLNELTEAAGPEEIRAAELELEAAQIAATQAAEQHSTILVTEPNDFLSAETLAELEYAARANAVQANARLAAAQEALAALQNGDQNSAAAAQAGLAAAIAQRDLAQAQLDLLLAGASGAQIAAATANLAQAIANRDQLLRGPSEAQIVTAEVAVEQARLALAQAENNLARATLAAPFAGTITAITVSQGEQATGVVMELVDNNTLEVVLNIDEVDMADLALGQPATVTLETWPGVAIPGEVASIAPRATADDSALVTYEVYLTLDESDLPILVGMTANADLVTAQKEAVLLLPNAAINVDRATGTYSVNLVTQNDGSAPPATTETPVTIGLRDGRYTEITSGLEAGDEVMISNALPVQGFGPGEDPGDGQPQQGGPFGG
jgi:HlyD family secretion protein